MPQSVNAETLLTIIVINNIESFKIDKQLLESDIVNTFHHVESLRGRNKDNRYRVCMV